jgi:hypothetical protein
MSKEIIIVLKDGMKYAGNEYRYNHYKRRFELLNDVCIAGAFPPDQIREIRTGKISENSEDDRDKEAGF